MSQNLLLVAGEVSGDMHAAALVRALRRRQPELSCWGIGGDDMAAAGVELIRHAQEMSVIGIAEVIRRFPFFYRAFHDTLRRVRENPPAAAVLVDYPGFNLRLARALHGLGVRVVYYVCPQVWAWHRSRIRSIAETVDRLLVIFPFEVDVFRGLPLRVEFVGHPLADLLRDAPDDDGAALPWEGTPRVAMLPGSRRQEIARILPAQIEAAALVQRRHPDASFLIAAPNAEAEGWVRAAAESARARPTRCAVVTGRTRRVLREARAAWVASGTATLEAALLGCPMVVVYRMAPLNFALAKCLVRVPYIGMVNLVAGREVCPELVQSRAQPAALAGALTPLLDDTPERLRMREQLDAVKERLGAGGAAERAADAVLEEMTRSGR